MLFKNAQIVKINNKRVQSITTNNNGIIYQSALKMTVSGNHIIFVASIFRGTGSFFIDWGDDTIEEYGIMGFNDHYYTDNNTIHTITIYGNVTTIDEGLDPVSSNFTVKSINIPKSVTTISNNAFEQCNGPKIILNWYTSNTIIPYNDSWLYGNNNPNLIPADFKFLIPNGTTNLYTAKGYSSYILQEI